MKVEFFTCGVKFFIHFKEQRVSVHNIKCHSVSFMCIRFDHVYFVFVGDQF